MKLLPSFFLGSCLATQRMEDLGKIKNFTSFKNILEIEIKKKYYENISTKIKF